MSHSELMDVVTDDDTVIEVLPRYVIYEKKLNFRAINAFIINTQGQIWIPRRHPTKKLFPLHLDTSVGGHVQAGESYDAAFERETEEEVNINITNMSYKMLTKLTPSQHGTSAFMHVYLIYYNQDPDYNTDDFIEAFWMTPQELLNKIDQGEKVKSDLPKILKAIKMFL